MRMLTEKDERESHETRIETLGAEQGDAEVGFFWNQQFQDELEDELDDEYDDL